MSNIGYLIQETVCGSSDKAHRQQIIGSKNTVAVAAAGASGLRIEEYQRCVEDVASVGPQSVCVWKLEEGYVEFRPDFAAEQVSTAEFLRRMRDTNWQRENPHHPIAYMAAAVEAYKRLVRTVHDSAPLITFRRGKQTAYLCLKGDRENQRRLLLQAKFGADEVERIIAQLERGRK